MHISKSKYTNINTIILDTQINRYVTIHRKSKISFFLNFSENVILAEYFAMAVVTIYVPRFLLAFAWNKENI